MSSVVSAVVCGDNYGIVTAKRLHYTLNMSPAVLKSREIFIAHPAVSVSRLVGIAEIKKCKINVGLGKKIDSRVGSELVRFLISEL